MAKIFKPQKKPINIPAKLEIERQSHDGRGIARYQGKTVFVEGALVGETVSVKQYRDGRRYAECRAADIVQDSPQRQLPDCEYYQRCGGCNLQHLQVESQLDFKQSSVIEQLNRVAELQAEEVVPALSSTPWGYRSRARLGVDRQGRIAFRQRDSSQFVAIEHCPVLAAELQPLIHALQELPKYAKSCAITHVELVFADDVVAAVVRHTRPMTAQGMTWLQAVADESDALIWLQGAKRGPLCDLSSKIVDPRLYYRLPDFDVCLAFHPSDFTQVNLDINRRMVSQAIEWLDLKGHETLLDLFCGVGNFTLPLARCAQRVIGVEAVESMVERGRENAAAHNMDNCTFVAADLENPRCEEAWNQTSIDAVLLDPPRAGAQQAVALLGRISAQRIVYVSCNPASLARDAQALAQQGFSLAKLGVMDMFPHTAHIESMALFVREK
jgi:23S rRNA (uracil1939-C5)-methyltransferase